MAEWQEDAPPRALPTELPLLRSAGWIGPSAVCVWGPSGFVVQPCLLSGGMHTPGLSHLTLLYPDPPTAVAVPELHFPQGCCPGPPGKGCEVITGLP